VSAPTIVVEIPVEGRALAFCDYCYSDDDERRLALDVEGRDLLGEVVDVLVVLLAEIDERCEGTS
jgi:hypothetical protein